MCRFDTQLLCVNNYRGEEYNKPDDLVGCEDCIFNPKNDGLKKSSFDGDKVVKDELQEIVKEKIIKIKDGKKEIHRS